VKAVSRKVFRELVSVEEAKRRLSEYFTPQPVGVEAVPLDRAYGRTLAGDVEATIDVPPFDRAAMDGFALNAGDTFGAEEDKPVTLRVVGKIGAGEEPKIDVKRGEAVEISTGAPMPKGANAVVMVEYTWREGEYLKVCRPVSPGENVTAAGSDIMAGELILRRGTVLTPRETGVLAALGISEVKVFKKPRVAVISTGNEIVKPGERLEYGKIYDVNSRTISDAVKECGGEPIFLGIARDSPDEIREKIKEGVSVADVVIASGGTSAGVGDLLYRIINDLGRPGVLVHGVSVKPGKPTVIAVANGKPIFGLPGYPTSALMIFDIFVDPIIRSMAGLTPSVERRTVEARAAERIFSSGGRREYLPVNLVKTEAGEYMAYHIPGGSGAITTLAEADGFVEIPEGKAFVEAGEPLKVKLYSSELKPADLTIIGSHCVGIDILLELMMEKYPRFCYKVINVGSSGGLAAIRRGEADVAGTHLLDEATGEYNTPFLKRYGVEDKAALARGYIRKQGLIVAKGNPKNIKGLEDLLRDDVTLINRNPGSGTRVLLDMKLMELSNEKGIEFKDLTSGIRGYEAEAKSHTAVAVAVLTGKADVGLGIKTASDRYGLDFIPLADELYDFAINVKRLEKWHIKSFLETLRSEEFKQELKRRALGLTPTEETGEIIYSPKSKVAQALASSSP
jgi:putative molybdopterin biosynthesis protein